MLNLSHGDCHLGCTITKIKTIIEKGLSND